MSQMGIALDLRIENSHLQPIHDRLRNMLIDSVLKQGVPTSVIQGFRYLIGLLKVDWTLN